MGAGGGSNALFTVLGKLDPAGIKKSGSGYEARCPTTQHAHGDKHPSLSVAVGDDGRVLLRCHAGCDTGDILNALSLTWADLFEKSSSGDRVRRFRVQSTNGKVVEHVRVDRPTGKDVWWETNGHRGLDGTPVTELPLFGIARLASVAPTAPVIVCEGEKAAQALIDAGVVAVGTVTGADHTPSAAVLAVLKGHEVWLWADNDDIGRQHMQRIAARLHPGQVRWIVWPGATDKGADAADYLAAGWPVSGIADMLVADTVSSTSTSEPTSPPPPSNGVTAGVIIFTSMADLQVRVLPEPRWAVPSLFPEGVVLFVGKSKLGKSWFALDVAIAVAAGARVWGQVPVEPGEVLYMALEDSERRLQDRMRQIYGEQPWPASFLYATKFPRADEGGIDLLLRWLDEHPKARLVVIDVLGKFRPKEANIRRLYDMDYDAIAPIAEVARQRGVCVLILHHSNKLKPEDPIDSVSGTTGLVGAADAICIFRRERGKADAALLLTGRDIEEQELAFRFVLEQAKGYAWELVGDAEALRTSNERQQILEVLSEQGGVTPTDIAGAVGRSTGSVRHLLWKMTRDGQARNIDGKYFLGLFSNRGNTGNTVTPEIKNGTSGVTPSSPGGNTPPVTDVSTRTTVSHVTSGTAREQSFQKGVTRGSTLCRSCGLALSPQEAATRYQLHWDCTLPMGEKPTT